EYHIRTAHLAVGIFIGGIIESLTACIKSLKAELAPFVFPHAGERPGVSGHKVCFAAGAGLRIHFAGISENVSASYRQMPRIVGGKQLAARRPGGPLGADKRDLARRRRRLEPLR